MKPEELLSEALPEHQDGACSKDQEAHHSCLAYSEAMLAASPRLAAVMELGLRAGEVAQALHDFADGVENEQQRASLRALAERLATREPATEDQTWPDGFNAAQFDADLAEMGG